MTTVENIVTRPGGAVVVGGRVRVRLIASIPAGGAGFATDRTIISERWLVTDSVGAWSADLTPNASVTPAGTVYEVIENAGHAGATAYYVTVPGSGGPYWTGDILTTEPAPLPVTGPRSEDAFSLYIFNQSIAAPNASGQRVNVDPTTYAGYDPDPDVSTGGYLYDPSGHGTTAADPAEPYGGALGGYYLKGFEPGSVWAVRFAVRYNAGTFVASDRILLSSPYPQPAYEYPDPWTDDTAPGLFGAPTYAYLGTTETTYGAVFPGGVFNVDPAPAPLYRDARFALWNFSTGFHYQASGEAQTLNLFELDLWRIA